MQTRRALASGVVLCVLTIAYYSYILPGAPGKTAKNQPQQDQHGRVAYQAEGSQWTVGSAIRSGNLTVFPVIADSWERTDEFITLDEGLKSGGVTITELGVGGRSRDRQAQVNTLSLTNRTGKTLVLLAGEMLVGGKQDRIVDHDRLLPSEDTPTELGVFCVEHGRWQGVTQSFGQNHSTGGAPVHGARNFLASGAAEGPGQIANPSVREKAEAAKSQSAVWSEVADSTTKLGATSSTGALTRAYQDSRLATRVHRYEKEIRSKLTGKNIVGVIASVNGVLVTADIFASPSLFRRYESKLLESYALEALTDAKAIDKPVDRAAVQAFLSRVGGALSSEGKDGVYRLIEHKSGGDSSFELESLSMSPPVLVHFNRITAR
jgi:hypothetical protein